MSASTVSITANQVSVRRQPVLLVDKKSNPNIELVPAENGANADNRANVSGNSKDLSHHSIWGGEARDLAAVKKALGNSTISPCRARKVAPEPEPPPCGSGSGSYMATNRNQRFLNRGHVYLEDPIVL